MQGLEGGGGGWKEGLVGEVLSSGLIPAQPLLLVSLAFVAPLAPLPSSSVPCFLFLLFPCASVFVFISSSLLRHPIFIFRYLIFFSRSFVFSFHLFPSCLCVLLCLRFCLAFCLSFRPYLSLFVVYSNDLSSAFSWRSFLPLIRVSSSSSFPSSFCLCLPFLSFHLVSRNSCSFGFYVSPFLRFVLFFITFSFVSNSYIASFFISSFIALCCLTFSPLSSSSYIISLFCFSCTTPPSRKVYV